MENNIELDWFNYNFFVLIKRTGRVIGCTILFFIIRKKKNKQ